MGSGGASYKDLLSKIHKELKLNNKKTNVLIKKKGQNPKQTAHQRNSADGK